MGFAITQRGGGMSYTGATCPRRPIPSCSTSARSTESSPSMRTSGDYRRSRRDLAQIWEALTPRTCVCLSAFWAPRPSGVDCRTGRYLWERRAMARRRHCGWYGVIDGSGRRIRTGQAAFHNGRPGFRQYGPDLTGLLVHDAGALGVKTVASLHVPLPEAPNTPPLPSPLSRKLYARSQPSDAVATARRVYLFDPVTTTFP